MGNGHCVADLEALILFTVRLAITYSKRESFSLAYRYRFWLIDINCSVNEELSSVINFLAQKRSRFFCDPSCLAMRHDGSVILINDILIQTSFPFVQLSVKSNSRRPILKPKSVVSSGIFTPDK